MSSKLNIALRDMEAHIRAVFDADRNFEDGPTEPVRPVRKSIREILRASIAWLFRLARFARR